MICLASLQKQYTFNAARSNHRDQLSDVLEGLAYIHRLKLAHGDLKPENVVLTTQARRLTAKLCDFGSARDVPSKGHTSVEYTCTALYRSPELSAGEDKIPNPSFAADIWAFGCIAFVVQSLPHLFGALFDSTAHIGTLQEIALSLGKKPMDHRQVHRIQKAPPFRK
ncbi:kinase-like protein [Ceratobasidium sp. AG-I]|nr:kinase-like protein [Ceratobasidium sp. AG-I]